MGWLMLKPNLLVVGYVSDSDKYLLSTVLYTPYLPVLTELC